MENKPCRRRAIYRAQNEERWDIPAETMAVVVDEEVRPIPKRRGRPPKRKDYEYANKS